MLTDSEPTGLRVREPGPARSASRPRPYRAVTPSGDRYRPAAELPVQRRRYQAALAMLTGSARLG